jgi:hypothetical protein
MYELIDPTVTDGDRPVSDWVGKVTRANVLSLAERGAGGGYVWSREELPTLVGALQSLPSPISTHPDYWYSIPFTVAAAPYQSELTIEALVVASSDGVSVRLWCEGVASDASPPVTTTGVITRTVTIPPRPAGTEMRCALLLRSQVGASVDTGDVENATVRSFRSTTNVAPVDEMATHYLLELGTADDPIRGWQGETRYHTLRGVRRGHDVFEVWPRPDPSLNDAVDYTVPVTLYQLGTLTLLSLQVRAETATVPGIPQAAQTNGGLPVRAPWLTRVGALTRRVWETSPQYAWIGGVGGVARSTGTTVGADVIPYRLWGAWIPRRLSPVDVVQTVVRKREGMRSIVVVMLYASSSRLLLTLELDGTDALSAELPMYLPPARDRHRSADPGTLHWRHAELARDQCSSQDLGLHGADLDGWDNDTSRLAMGRVEFLLPDGYSDGDLIRLRLEVACSDDCYVAGVSIREGIDATGALPGMTVPVIAPLRDIVSPSWDALRQRQADVYATRVRAVYGEWAEPLATIRSVTSGSVCGIAYTTSPDLPPGTVLRMTCEAECTSGTSVTVSIDIGGGPSSLVFTTRAVQTVALAVSSETAYQITIAAVAAAASVGSIYLLRIEEVAP